MNKSNILKIVIAGLLLFVVVVATVNYGRNQRAKLATDTVKDNLPTVQEAKPSESSNKPSQQQPKPESKPEPAPAVTAPAQSSPNASAPAVSAQIPQSSMPATGPADSIIPTIILGTLTGFYLVSRRRLKADSSFTTRSKSGIV